MLLSYFSCVQLFVTLWTVACQAPLSMGFSGQEYWSRLPCPPPGDLPNPEMEPASLKFPAQAGGFFTTSATWEALNSVEGNKKETERDLLYNIYNLKIQIYQRKYNFSNLQKYARM